MVEYATKELKAANDLHDRNILLEICAGVARTCRYPYTFLWRYEPPPGPLHPYYGDYKHERYKLERRALSPDATIHDQLIAAISVGARDAVAQLLPQVPARLPEGAFEDPILACVLLDDQDMIILMMKALDEHKSKRFKQEQVIAGGSPYNVGSAMETAITHSRVDMVKLLLGYLCRYLTLPDKTYYRRWVDLAINVRRTEVLKAFLQAASNTKPFNINSVVFKKGLRTGKPAIVSTLIKYGSIQLDSDNAQMSALAASIRTGGVPVIRAVVKAGADIDLVITTHRLKHVGAITPVEYAVYLKKYEAVTYMIECGAKAPAIATWPTSRKMRNVLQNAVAKRKTTTK